MNYLKRQRQSWGTTGPTHWEKWIAALGRCGNERRDEKNKIIKKYIYRLTVGNLTRRAKGIYKNISNVQNLIFKQNLFEFK
jgi:hypothetical protein